jgi:hypothetical protein
MKINEIIIENQQQQLKVVKDNAKETELVDPKTNVKTIVPKDPKKPGAIAKDVQGNLTMAKQQKGPVNRGIKPGDKVSVQ